MTGDRPAEPLIDRALSQLRSAAQGISGPERAREYQDLLRRNPRALHRDGGPVHLTASAIVIDAPADHVALVWHRKGRFWVQPGGHLEDGESGLEQAARREVAEETGLEDLIRVGEGPAMLHQHGLDAAFGACREHWDVQYLLRTRVPAAEAPLGESAETPESRWVPWPRSGDEGRRDSSQLPAGTVPDLPGTLEQIAVLLARQGL